MKLEIEMIPQTAWYSNLRKVLSQEDWDILRKEAYRNANYHCEICGCSGQKLHAHEIWEFNMETHKQVLKKIIAVCPQCHGVIHLGFTSTLGASAYAAAVKHFLKVNECTLNDFNKAAKDAKKLWEERSQVEWELDVSLIENRGFKLQIEGR